MNHFVSKSCEGERCACGKDATHKLGEEIPHDEPCLSCGETWKGKENAPATFKQCLTLYHYPNMGAESQRHNLTAYVCCPCFTKILGPATNCPES